MRVDKKVVRAKSGQNSFLFVETVERKESAGAIYCMRLLLKRDERTLLDPHQTLSRDTRNVVLGVDLVPLVAPVNFPL